MAVAVASVCAHRKNNEIVQAEAVLAAMERVASLKAVPEPTPRTVDAIVADQHKRAEVAAMLKSLDESLERMTVGSPGYQRILDTRLELMTALAPPTLR